MNACQRDSQQGKGSRDHWIKDRNGNPFCFAYRIWENHLWTSWSAEDQDFKDEWEDSNPCENVWHSFKGNGVGLGTLIHLADLEDPLHLRFSDDIAKIVKDASNKQVQEFGSQLLNTRR